MDVEGLEQRDEEEAQGSRPGDAGSRPQRGIAGELRRTRNHVADATSSSVARVAQAAATNP